MQPNTRQKKKNLDPTGLYVWTNVMLKFTTPPFTQGGGGETLGLLTLQDNHDLKNSPNTVYRHRNHVSYRQNENCVTNCAVTAEIFRMSKIIQVDMPPSVD